MIRHKNRVHKGFSLMPETIAKIKVKAIEEELNDSRALDLIVHEWFGSIEIEPIKRPPNLSDLAQFEQSLKNCNQLAQELRAKLKRMSL